MKPQNHSFHGVCLYDHVSLFYMKNALLKYVQAFTFTYTPHTYRKLISLAYLHQNFNLTASLVLCYCITTLILMTPFCIFSFLHQPKLTMARCRRNVDNFLEACRKIGVEEVGTNMHYCFVLSMLLVA